MESIIQKQKVCFICGTTIGLDDHHIFFNAKRKWAEKYGLKVWLCREHHTGNYSPHRDRILDMGLKQLAQSKFEETYTREDFRRIFGKSYL